MPKTSIYIRDEDVEMFEKARKLAGDEGLSRVVADTVYLYVRIKEAEKDGMEEIRLEIGVDDNTEEIAFIGKMIVEYTEHHGQTSGGNDRWTDYKVYLTSKDYLLLYKEHGSCWQGETKRSEYETFMSFVSFEGAAKLWDGDDDYIYIPKAVIGDVREALGRDKATFLDI